MNIDDYCVRFTYNPMCVECRHPWCFWKHYFDEVGEGWGDALRTHLAEAHGVKL